MASPVECSFMALAEYTTGQLGMGFRPLGQHEERCPDTALTEDVEYWRRLLRIGAIVKREPDHPIVGLDSGDGAQRPLDRRCKRVPHDVEGWREARGGAFHDRHSIAQGPSQGNATVQLRSAIA